MWNLHYMSKYSFPDIFFPFLSPVFHMYTSNNLSVCLPLLSLLCLHLLFFCLQWEKETAGEHRESHPVQLERAEVHSHRRAQDQPVTARLHQEPVWFRPRCSWELKWARWRNGDSWFENQAGMMKMMIRFWVTSHFLQSRWLCDSVDRGSVGRL